MADTTKVTVSEKQASSSTEGLKINVLVIDPEPNSRSRLKDILRGLEMVESVQDRPSSHLLLDILLETPIDVVMIDQNPGPEDVFEVAHNIKRNKQVGSQVEFLLMGNTLNQEMVVKGKQVGIRSYLPKPFDIAKLEKALTIAIPPEKRAAAAQEAKAAPSGGNSQHDHLKETLDKLRQVALFTGFSDNELVRLLRICKSRNFPAGTYVFKDGDAGDSLYIIVSGKLEIRKVIDGVDKVLVNMRPGDCFGEMALIDQSPRFADAVAATDCTVIDVHESIVNNNEDVLSLKLVRQIAILLAKKLRAQSK